MSKFKVGDVVRRIFDTELHKHQKETVCDIEIDQDGTWLRFEGDDSVYADWNAGYYELVHKEIQNNSNQNPNNIPNFKLRWTIYETAEELHNSWNSEGKVTVVKQSKPVLQYSVDGVEWNNVPEVVIKTN